MKKISDIAAKNTSVQALTALTPHVLKLLDAAQEIRSEPDAAEAAFMARQLVQCTLPHANPGNIPLWRRTNGNLTLGIQPGYDLKTGTVPPSRPEKTPEREKEPERDRDRGHDRDDGWSR